MQENPESTTMKLEAAVGLYSDMLFRICLNMLGNTYDAEDALQETYLRYMKYAPDFTGTEHEKAWLLRVCVNVCRNSRASRSRHECADFDELANYLTSPEDVNKEVLEAVMALPEKYRTVMDLYYIEGLDTAAVSSLLGISPSAVRKRMQHGRELLKLELSE